MSNIVPIPKNDHPRRRREGQVVPFPQRGKPQKVYIVNSSMGIGEMAKQLIRQGADDETIIANVRHFYPRSKINANAIRWYKRKMREEGEDV